ncbi:ABC transporter ATP-binding protein [archaeon SCG-AAA382B04]|nr:ABC transporter ATP-binding protein [archaeon SCG-AAA382B04]
MLDRVISVKNLVKEYDGFRAVKDVSFEVKEGEIYGFLGPNGAGKSTTIKSMLGLIHSDGEIGIGGFDIREDGRKAKEKIGYLPERLFFYNNLTARQTLDFFGELRGVKPPTDSLLDQVGLLDEADKRVGDFSKGMIQLLGIAQAMVGDPEIYILDEPLSGLDPRWVKVVREKIKKLNEEGATIFFSSHNLNEVQNLSDRVSIIDNGKKIAEDSVQNLNEYLQIKPKLIINIPGLNGEIPSVLQEMHEIESIDASENKFTIECDPNARSRVLAKLEEEGMEIDDFETVQPSLEDAFVRLISKEEEE